MSQYQSELISQTTPASVVDEGKVSKQAKTQHLAKADSRQASANHFFEHWLKSDQSICTKNEHYTLHPGKSAIDLKAESAMPKSLWQANATSPDVNVLIEMASSLCGANSQSSEFRAHLLRGKENKDKESPLKEDACKEVDSTEVIRSRMKAEHALEDALQALKPYALEKECLEAQALIDNIQKQNVALASTELKEARARLLKAKGELRGNKSQYTKSLKALKKYAHLVVEYCKMEPDQIQAQISMICAVEEIERMMEPVETAWKGIPGKTADLPRVMPTDTNELARLEEIKKHLEVKVDAIDAKQTQRLENIATHPIIETILKKHDEGSLPEGGSIFFFTGEGRPLYRIDTSSRPRPRHGQSLEDAFKHATKTPEFIDIDRLKGGLGPDGAGLFRFADLIDAICGAVILTPVVRDGKMIQLPGMSKPKRVVAETIGIVPDFVTPGTPYSAILNRFRQVSETLLTDCLKAQGIGDNKNRAMTA
ncbi:MAG: hypothetical protein K8F91_23600 [Candidatus Obscuribacterales bacterium]|nr:hypothetical protein [Candidatus Obscuribacterales bacterium]